MDLHREERILHSTTAGTHVHVEHIRAADANCRPSLVLVLHGLGDHFGRHEWAVRLLASRGFEVLGFDWPGNGLSGGKRGDLPGTERVGALIGEILRSESAKPVGVLAHSTGGFFLAKALRECTSGFELLHWVWFSSPLIEPAHGQPGWKRALAGVAADWFPGLSVTTGVRPVDCYHPAPGDDPYHFRADSHNRITLRAGADLIRAAESARMVGPPPISLPVLLTQGAEDEVCPPILAEAFLDSLPSTDKTLILASGARHEPFREPHPEGFLAAASAWLRLRTKSPSMASSLMADASTGEDVSSEVP